MACALTQGYNLDCRDAIGGIKEVYIIETSNISSYTEASGVVTALTKKTGTRFWKYQLIKETSNTEEDITGNEQNGTIFYAQKVNVIINKQTTSVRNEILLLAKNYVSIAVIDNSGVGRIFGVKNGLLLNAGNSNSGTAWGDRNGYTLNFTGNEIALAQTLDASVVTALETPG